MRTSGLVATLKRATIAWSWRVQTFEKTTNLSNACNYLDILDLMDKFASCNLNARVKYRRMTFTFTAVIHSLSRKILYIIIYILIAISRYGPSDV